MTELNRQQALVPAHCTYLANKTGTAPGMWFEKKGESGKGKIFVSMPGVPHEMKYLMANEVIPRLKKYFETPVIYHKMIRTIGVGESFLAEKIEKWEDALPPHIKLAYLPSFGQVRLRLTGVGEHEETLKQEVQQEIDKVLPMIQSFVFGYDDEDLEVALGKLLKSKGKTVSAAESCTGGFISHLFTKVPGSSAYFMGGVVSYDNSVKINVLGVKPDTITAHGAVSEETVTQMAEGVRSLLKTDFAVATSGVAGPDGGTPEKPVGTLWIACAMEGRTIARKVQMANQRETNINYGSVVAMNLLRKMLNGDYES
jgi:nicotinamide-nucleotide amidase